MQSECSRGTERCSGLTKNARLTENPGAQAADRVRKAVVVGLSVQPREAGLRQDRDQKQRSGIVQERKGHNIYYTCLISLQRGNGVFRPFVHGTKWEKQRPQLWRAASTDNVDQAEEED